MKLTTLSINVLVTGGLLTAIVALTGCEKPEEQDTNGTQEVVAQDVQAQGNQTTCPVMGGAINKDLYVDANGKRIYVCCAGCIEEVRKDPEKYIQKLAEKGEVPASVPEEAEHLEEAHDMHEGHDGHH